MSDPYRDDYGEFHPDSGWPLANSTWAGECADTLAAHETGRSDWATISTFYPWLRWSTANPGPTTLPLAVTQVVVAPVSAAEPLSAPRFLLTHGGARYVPDSSARAFLFPQTDDRLLDLGSPTLDQVLARGARVGDRLCVYEIAAQRQGCLTIQTSSQALEVGDTPGWQPQLLVTPVTSRTLTLDLSGVPVGLAQVQARLYPAGAPPTAAMDLISAGTGHYSGTITPELLSEPAFQGYVQVWAEVNGQRREVVTDYLLSGNPGRAWAGSAPRGNPGRAWAGSAPVLSSDGQAIVYSAETDIVEGQFFVLQAASALPPPPSWATPVGRGYWLTVSDPPPSLHNASISMGYLGSEVTPEQEGGIRVYFWDGARWQLLPTVVDSYQNEAVAPLQGPGLYTLMTSVEVPLRRAGWNLFAYPVHATRPVTEALASIEGYYTTVYSYDETDVDDPWKVYDTDAPPWVNDLTNMEYGRGYWIRATQAITVLLQGDSTTPAALQSNAGALPTPPATYYGEVLAGIKVSPTSGMEVVARVNGAVCGQAQTRLVSGQVVYVVDVLADDGGAAAGCGVPGRVVQFEVGGQPIATTALWAADRPHQLTLHSEYHNYLPVIMRGP
jgi:hypothetical protein